MIHLLLDIIIFVSGAVLMALEIVGSRVLAPYFGNSIFVWGSLISVVLAALSAGYYWGGRLSEKNPSFAKLLLLLLVPGVMIFFLPFFYPAVNLWVAETDFGARANPLIVSAIYFLVPGIFLGMVSPYAIRLAATTLSTVGSTAGTLYALQFLDGSSGPRQSASPTSSTRWGSRCSHSRWSCGRSRARAEKKSAAGLPPERRRRR